MPHFNSRPSARGDVDVTSGDMPGSVVFQFTPLREGRPAPPGFTRRFPYFNSRPSARGDAHPHSHIRTARIFQFTPLREGRREIACIDLCKGNISIHAPPRGATMTQATLYIGLNISIHAPPRGATWVSVKDALPPNFNSRPSARGDTGAPLSVRPSSLFQFTPLREGRLNPPPPRAAVPLFQFTPLREGRLGIPTVPCIRLISIHAPPRGATRGARA